MLNQSFNKGYEKLGDWYIEVDSLNVHGCTMLQRCEENRSDVFEMEINSRGRLEPSSASRWTEWQIEWDTVRVMAIMASRLMLSVPHKWFPRH